MHFTKSDNKSLWGDCADVEICLLSWGLAGDYAKDMSEEGGDSDSQHWDMSEVPGLMCVGRGVYVCMCVWGGRV